MCFFLLELLLQNSGRLLLLCNLLAESFRLGGDPGHHDRGAHDMEIMELMNSGQPTLKTSWIQRMEELPGFSDFLVGE